MLSLSGCAMAPFSSETPRASNLVPDLVEYTPAEQRQLVDALQRIAASDAEAHRILSRMVRDYLALRDKTRASREALQ